MLFNSIHFLFFLPVFIGLFYALPATYRWLLIFIASCYFYMAFVPAYILILFAIILIDFFTAKAIEGTTKPKLKKGYLVLSLVSNLGILCFFKYYNFLNENIAQLTSLMGLDYTFKTLSILFPIGLSFHTFQSMAYTIEVYRGHQKAETHLGYFANYVLFFPQMVAGPIEKYSTLGHSLKQPVKPLYENFANGFRLILFGLFVKMTVADTIAPVVNVVFDAPQDYSSLQVLVAILLFPFQIYADFYGYSTIAIGAARLMGIPLMDNFKTPLLANSLNDYWRRWHISLTNWFREYVYFPLGGSKNGKTRMAVNFLIVFALSGLWHGASWNFVMWGLLHGAVCLLERLTSKVFKFEIQNKQSLLNSFLKLKTFFVVAFIFVFFRADSWEKVVSIFKALIHNGFSVTAIPTYGYTFFFVFVLIVCELLLYNTRFDKWIEPKPMALRWTFYFILLFFLLGMSGLEQLEFIYFRF